MDHTSNERGSSDLRVAVASMIGTCLEFYDHFIYGAAAALVFPQIFFPQDDRRIALLLSLLTYGLAFAARPLGAAIFGHFGDRIGRKRTLIVTLMLMGSTTFLIGLLPTYAMLGAWAAVGLCVLRLLQGIALGGEWGGAVLMVVESAKKKGRLGFLGSMVQVAAPAGFLLANGVFTVVTASTSDSAFLAWGWRIPFLISALLVFVGIYIRRTIAESPEFTASVKSQPRREEHAPLSIVFRQHWGKLLVAVGARAGSDIAFYIFALFLQVYLARIGVSKLVALEASVMAAVAQIVAIPLFGKLTDRYGAGAVLVGGALGAIVWSFVFFQMVDTRIPAMIIVAAMVGLFIHAALWAPLATYLPAMFPVQVRYTGAGFGFQLAGVVGGGLAPVIATLLLNTYQSSTPVAIYVAASLVFIIVAVAASSRWAAAAPRQQAVLR